MMNKSEWKKVKLEECADINMGQSPISSSYNIDGNGIPFYQGNADFGELYPKLRYYCSKPIKVANEEDLLLSVRAPIGKINIAKTSCCIGRGLCAITPKKDIVLQKYLYYILKYKENEFNLKGTGSTFKAINKKQISETMFLLPDINIQKNIILKLENSEKLLKLKKEQLSELEKLVKFQFLKMFGNPILNEKNWKKEKLDKYISIINGYAFESKNFLNSGIPVLRIANINTGVFKPINIVYWKKDEKLKKYIVYPDDLVITLTGTVGKDDYGNVCILDKSYDYYYLNQRNAKLELKSFINKYYLSFFLKIPIIKKKLTNINRGVRQANISNRDILNLEILIPPIELQNKFAEFVKQVDKSKVELQKSIDETQLLFDSLMDKYFG